VNICKRTAALACAASLAFLGVVSPAAQATEASALVGFELLESKTLSDGWGTLRLWQNDDNGCLHADIVNAPTGVVATERQDGQVITHARNTVSGGSVSTAETHTRNGDIRGVMRSDAGRTTITKWYQGAATC
jgi:hypothetical protein